MPFTMLGKVQNIPAEMKSLQTTNKSLRLALNLLLTTLAVVGTYYVLFKPTSHKPRPKKHPSKKDEHAEKEGLY